MLRKLEEMCTAKVVAEICCRPKIKEQFLTINLMSRKPRTKNYDDFIKLSKILEQQFLDGLKNLPYPIRLIMPKHLINFMAIEIMKWVKDYYSYGWDGFSLSYCLNILKSSHFTNKGTLDKVLIAREMIQDKSLDVHLRICIAADYFLIEDIRALWGETSEEEKKCIRKRKIHKHDWEVNHFKRILYFATEDSINHEYLLPICFHAFHFNNEVAFIKNCWKWLNLSEKEIVSRKCVRCLLYDFPLVSYINRDNSYDSSYDDAIIVRAPKLEFVIFFIYNMNEELLKTILKESLLENHLLVLKYLLFWPYQDIFMKTLKLIWEKITHIHFYELLHSIIDMIEDDEISNTYNYRLILKEVWDIAPPDYRKKAISKESEKFRPSYAAPKFFTFENEGVKFAHYYLMKRVSLLTFLLSRLFCLKTFTHADVIFVKQIASDANASEKQKIVSKQGDDICEAALISGELGLAKLFMECFVEKELINEYKQGFFTRRSKYISELLLSSEKKSLHEAITKWASDL